MICMTPQGIAPEIGALEEDTQSCSATETKNTPLDIVLVVPMYRIWLL